jgi:hypothetical protein
VPEVPFVIGGAALDFPRGGAILTEGFDEARLAASAAGLGDGLDRLGLGGTMATCTRYRLAYALDIESLARAVPVAPQAHGGAT